MTYALESIPLQQAGTASSDRHNAFQGSTEPFFDTKNQAQVEVFASDANHILFDHNRPRTYRGRVIALAALTLNAFSIIYHYEHPKLQPSRDELECYFDASEALKASPNSSYLKELIDKYQKPFETTSPVAIAQVIKRRHSLHSETADNLLVIKLWTVQQLDTNMPSEYDDLFHITRSKPKVPNFSPIVSY